MKCFVLFKKKCGSLWTKKVVKQCKQSLMSSLSKSLEDSNTESYVDCGSPDQEVSEGNIIAPELEIILVLFWERMWLVYPFSKNLSGAKFQSSGLIFCGADFRMTQYCSVT